MKFTRSLQYGNWGNDVKDLQKGLNQMCYFKFMIMGFFGEKTMKAVIQFQKDNNIEPAVGYFGQITQPIFLSKLSAFNRQTIYDTACLNLKTDVSPNDIAPDEYGCAETVSDLLKMAGFDIGLYLSTYQLYYALKSNSGFIRVDTPLYGDIIISPTGFGNGMLPNGHVGICGKDDKIMSNNSFTGLFEENYTQDAWKARYQKVGGYPLIYFRKI